MDKLVAAAAIAGGPKREKFTFDVVKFANSSSTASQLPDPDNAKKLIKPINQYFAKTMGINEAF